MEDLSEDSAFHCMFGGRTHPIYDKKEEENYKIFSASFGLKKDYDYIIFFIEVPSNVDLNCITIKFYSEGDDEGTIIIIVVVILVIVVILGIAFLYFRHKKKKENAMKNELENIQKKRVEAIMLDERKKENNQNTINKNNNLKINLPTSPCKIINENKENNIIKSQKNKKVIISNLLKGKIRSKGMNNLYKMYVSKDFLEKIQSPNKKYALYLPQVIDRKKMLK